MIASCAGANENMMPLGGLTFSHGVLPALAVYETGEFPLTDSNTVCVVLPGGTTGTAKFRLLLLSVNVGGAETTLRLTGSVSGDATPETVTETLAL